jgi:hypothetical protein
MHTIRVKGRLKPSWEAVIIKKMKINRAVIATYTRKNKNDPALWDTIAHNTTGRTAQDYCIH